MFRFLILIGSLFLMSCSTTRFSTEVEKEIYHGKIQVITQHEYDINKPTERSKFLIQHSILQFARKGFKINEERFDCDTNTTAIWLYTYDKNDHLIEEKWLNGDSSVAYRTLYAYNKKNDLIREENFGSGNIFESRNEYKYYKASQMSEKASFDKKNNLLYKSVYSYQKLRMDETIYNAAGSFESLVRYTFDKDTKSIMVSEYNEQGDSTEVSIYKYENLGNIRAMTKANILDSTFEYYQYKYEYDKKGNWTMKLELRNDIPSKITLREYGYY